MHRFVCYIGACVVTDLDKLNWFNSTPSVFSSISLIPPFLSFLNLNQKLYIICHRELNFGQIRFRNYNVNSGYPQSRPPASFTSTRRFIKKTEEGNLLRDLGCAASGERSEPSHTPLPTTTLLRGTSCLYRTNISILSNLKTFDSPELQAGVPDVVKICSATTWRQSFMN